MFFDCIVEQNAAARKYFFTLNAILPIMKDFESLTGAIQALRENGFKEDFHLEENGICLKRTGEVFPPEKFKIERYHRFEGPSNPGDNSIVYAITANEGQVKGTLVDGYGIYSNPLSREMVQKLRPNEGQ